MHKCLLTTLSLPNTPVPDMLSVASYKESISMQYVVWISPYPAPAILRVRNIYQVSAIPIQTGVTIII